MLNWSNNINDTQIVSAIAERYIREVEKLNIKHRSKLDIMMDIEATHCNGNPLKLAELLKADLFNFMHDVSGIQNSLNRATGKLENCFVPRFSL